MRVPGESRAGKGSQPGPPRDSGRVPKGSKNRLFQGSRRTGDHQGSPRPFQGPPEAQNRPKLVQKWTNNVQKSLLATPLQPAIETAVKKIAIAAPLQPATETVETAVKKIVIAAPLQPATETAVKKIVIAAPLQ